jgi:hypothetical protein
MDSGLWHENEKKKEKKEKKEGERIVGGLH